MNKNAEEKYGVQEEAVEESSQEQPPQEAVEEQNDNVEQLESAKGKEDNLRILRERSERAERERDELMRKLQDMQSQVSTSSQQKQMEKLEEEVDYISRLGDDDLSEGKHIKQLYKQIRNLEGQLKKTSQQSSQYTTEMRIKQDFPDFHTVASYDNLKKLREMDEDLADAILATKDPYKQHALAYKMVKKMGIHVDDVYQDDKKRARENTSKPRPLTSISPQQGESPLSHANAFANGLTDELKEKLRKEMYDARKRM